MPHLENVSYRRHRARGRGNVVARQPQVRLQSRSGRQSCRLVHSECTLRVHLLNNPGNHLMRDNAEGLVLTQRLVLYI